MDTVIDTATALERVEGDEDLLRELALMLLESMPAMMEELRAACARADAEALERTAHTLKGSVGTLAAQRVWDTAQCLENSGRDGQLADSGALLAALEVEVGRLEEALRALV